MTPVRTDMWAELNTSAVNPAEGNDTTYAIIGYTELWVVSPMTKLDITRQTPATPLRGFRYF